MSDTTKSPRRPTLAEEAEAWVVVDTTVAPILSTYGVITRVEGVGLAELQDFDDPEESVVGVRVVEESRHERGCLETRLAIPFGETREWNGKRITCFQTRGEAEVWSKQDPFVDEG